MAQRSPVGQTAKVARSRRARRASCFDRAGRGWLRVRVPGRPNGRVGWVQRTALPVLERVDTQLVVNRGALRATLYRDGRPVGSQKNVASPGLRSHAENREFSINVIYNFSTLPAGTLPDQRTIIGTRTPPSCSERLNPRSGPELRKKNGLPPPS